MSEGASTESPMRVGVSQCLLGEEVRYDGGHKRDPYVIHVLGGHFEYVPVCPEVEAGFGTPREAMRLQGDPEAPRLVTIKTKADLTHDMAAWCERRVEELAAMDLDGYVLKSKSPSCGMERVKVYHEPGQSPRMGRGMFAEALMQRLPLLPVEEEGRLNDPHLRESFIVRVFCHHRWRAVTRQPFAMSRLVEFHTRHKLLLMSRSEQHMRELGRLVANAKRRKPEPLLEDYATTFFEGMKRRATARKHTNVLQHVAGYLKDRIDDWDRRELHDVIDRYRRGELPLIVPMTLLRHYVDKLGVEYVEDQHYLRPHPAELMLLNHV